MKTHSLRSPLLAATLALAALGAHAAHAYSGARAYLSDSITTPSAFHGQTISRYALTAGERAAVMPIAVSLKMRNLDSLAARLSQGQRISQGDMEANYLPALADYQAMQAWLTSQGFTLTQQDPNHTTVFAEATTGKIEAALGVTFARIATGDGEFTSAITAPSLPAELAGSTLAINGLQPQLRLHHQDLTPEVITIPNDSIPVTAPSDVMAQYNAPANFTASGQTIAVIMDGTCLASDYNAYCSTIGLNQTAAAFLTTITVSVSGETNNSDFDSEATLDVETASGMAPGAKVRLYNTPTTGFLDAQVACVQILADAKANNITVVSMSEGAPEDGFPAASMQAASQTFAQLAAAGITVLAGSGDGGSNPNTNGTNGYKPTNPLSVEYPASDPFVAGVGGTEMTIAPPTYARVSESGSWDVPGGTPFANGASGGGISGVFARPSWQTDGGAILASNVNRCVPDIAAVQGDIVAGVGTTGLIYVFNGVPGPGGGTSISEPLWGAIVADLNASRAKAGLGSIGLLGPAIYPLHATAFTDITTGSNGNYNAVAGYDLVTGLGVPNLAALNAAILSYNPSTAPSITGQPQSATVNTGSSFSLSVTAAGTATLTYQWFQGSAAISGATSPTYSVGSAATSNAGSYTVVVSNSAGSVTSSAAMVTVNTPVATTPAPTSGGSGGGGGGGAPSYWFYLALIVLGAARQATSKLRDRRRAPVDA
jgi:kumamolisin